jgi:hypothetical protein
MVRCLSAGARGRLCVVGVAAGHPILLAPAGEGGLPDDGGQARTSDGGRGGVCCSVDYDVGPDHDRNHLQVSGKKKKVSGAD